MVFQKHSSKLLCRGCFADDVRLRIYNEVHKYSMFGSGEKLLLAISGGKDSFVLFDVILKIHEPSKLGVITVLEGIEGYNRDEDVRWVIESSKELGIDCIRTSFKEVVGYSLKDLVARSGRSELNVSPCTFCGMIRRKIINKFARELGYDKVLTAHNLDDESQTAFINILRGDLSRLLQSHPKGPKLSELFIRRVKPLRKVYEWECALYAYLNGFKFQEVECPYITDRPTLRAKIREYLYKLESIRPGTLLKFLNSVDDLIIKYFSTSDNLPHLPTCSYCGEPTAYDRTICKTCELLIKVGVVL
ncbi:MAG: TIGR00269 family protein [Sulfolobales archaeon]|nr:TIGR00269 family protein [Sulfolobales archaeon]MCX8185576.1 TIGR00269 family protein [Sulfolobales archaeon]MDW7969519.1 TIGR00269 family protein [Sulfolobales archaeon]